MFLFLAATEVSEARAEAQEWIAVRAPASCDGATELAARVRKSLVAEPDPELRASVVIEAIDAGFEVTLRTTRGSRELGTKVLEVPTCDEAVDAAVVVLSLALSEEREGLRSAPSAPLEPSESSARESTTDEAPTFSDEAFAPPASRAPGPVDHGISKRASRHDDAPRPLRGVVSAGVDAGTLPRATLQVGAGLSSAFDRVELRGTAHYGLPYEEEELETGRSERQRYEFAALDLDACYGVGARWRLLGCAGSELAVVWSEDRVESEGDESVDEAARPRLAGVLSAIIAYRGSGVQPELEISSAIVLAGKQADASRVAVRASAGLGMQF